MGRTEAETVLAAALEEIPKSDVSKANCLIARNVFHEEIGLYGGFDFGYQFDQQKRDILLAYGRQDVAHALLNTISLLERSRKVSAQLRVLNVLAFAMVCLLGAIVLRLYSQL